MICIHIHLFPGIAINFKYIFNIFPIYFQALQYIVRLSELLNICSSGFWEPSMGEGDHIYQTKQSEDPYQHIYHID